MLGIWWRGLTPAGAVAGLAAGGIGSSTAALFTLYTSASDGWTDVLLRQPAAWSAPLATLVMVGVSLATRRTVPAHTNRLMVRLHTPEAVVLDRG